MNLIVLIKGKNAVFMYYSCANHTKYLVLANFFNSFLLIISTFLLHLHLISFIESDWRVHHPCETPNSNGSIEVHAMLKHAMVTHRDVEAGIGWEITT